MLNINIPIDTTFLSEVIYEGVLRYLMHKEDLKEALEYSYGRIPSGTLPLAGESKDLARSSGLG